MRKHVLIAFMLLLLILVSGCGKRAENPPQYIKGAQINLIESEPSYVLITQPVNLSRGIECSFTFECDYIMEKNGLPKNMTFKCIDGWCYILESDFAKVAKPNVQEWNGLNGQIIPLGTVPILNESEFKYSESSKP